MYNLQFRPERLELCHSARRYRSMVFFAAFGVICLAPILLMASFSQKGHQSLQKKTANPLLIGISPDVVTSGSAPATIRLRGTRLKLLTSVDLTDCEGHHSELPVANPQSGTFAVTIPVSFLLKPCVLHISGFALGVGDPQLAKFAPPSHASSAGEDLDWGGWFNHVMVSRDVDIPSNGEVVNVRVDTPGDQYVFVLGKHNATLFRVNPLKPPVPAMQGGTEFDLFLPGVHALQGWY